MVALFLILVAHAEPDRLRVVGEQGDWLGCTLHVDGHAVALVPLDGVVELPEGTLPGRGQLRCLRRRSPVVDLPPSPAELDVRGPRPVVGPWMLPEARVASALTALRGHLTDIARVTSELAEAGTALSAGSGDPQRARALATEVRERAEAARRVLDTEREALQPWPEVWGRLERLMRPVVEVVAVAGRIEEAGEALPAPLALVFLGGQVLRMTEALQQAGSAIDGVP